jgi:hypothetical protein
MGFVGRIGGCAAVKFLRIAHMARGKITGRVAFTMLRFAGWGALEGWIVR